jgi:hypothetical protein
MHIGWMAVLALAFIARDTAAISCWQAPGFKSIASADKLKGLVVFFSPGQAKEAREVFRIAQGADRELKDFFGVERNAIMRIYLAKDRAAFSGFAGKKIDWEEKWWLVGTAMTPTDVLIMSPAQWDERSRSYVKIHELIKHEMAHAYSLALTTAAPSPCIFQQEAGDDEKPYWFEEGLATYVSGQLVTWRNRVKYNFSTCPHFDDLFDCGGYATAATAVEYLIDTFGKEKILDAIRAMPPEHEKNENQRRSDEALFKTLGVSRRQLERGWHSFVLKTYPLPDGLTRRHRKGKSAA